MGGRHSKRDSEELIPRRIFKFEYGSLEDLKDILRESLSRSSISDKDAFVAEIMTATTERELADVYLDVVRSCLSL